MCERGGWTKCHLLIEPGFADFPGTHPYAVSSPTRGLWKVQFLLFKDGDFSSPYGALYRYMTVTQPRGASPPRFASRGESRPALPTRWAAQHVNWRDRRDSALSGYGLSTEGLKSRSTF